MTIILMRIPLYCRTARNPIHPTEADAYEMERFTSRKHAEKALRQLNRLAARMRDPQHHFLAEE
jgi:hypothetical protein